MAKKLNTTVHLTDDKGQSHVFGPNDELPGWAASQLQESWGDRDDLWEADKAPEELSVKEALEQGTPPPDRGPVEQDEPQGRDQEAIELGQEARTVAAEEAGEANEGTRAGALEADDDEVKPRGRRK